VREEVRRVGLITPTPEKLCGLKGLLESMGYEVLLEQASSPAEARGAAESLASQGADIIVLPGSWIGPWEPLSRELGVPVVRGAWSPKLLAAIVERWGFKVLSSSVEAEKALGYDMARLAVEELGVLRERPPRGEAFRVGGMAVPRLPPPILVVSEVYPSTCDVDRVLGEISWRRLEGADIVAIGWDGSVDLDCYWSIVKHAIDKAQPPLAADPGRPKLALKAASLGVDVSMSITPRFVDEIPGELRDKAFVVVPEGGDRPSKELEVAYRKGLSRGLSRLILDPIAFPTPYPGLLERLMEARRLAEAHIGPIMMGANNVVELMDADTEGSLGVTVSLMAEAGVSLVLVGEVSRKARGATWEARIAADMASLSLYWEKPPKDLGLDLLLYKEKS